jgi:glutathione reductase (NADPH)
MGFDYDLLVIGAGSGGLAASKRAASYGVRVAIAEQDQVGGTCVVRGCVPKKLMVYAADFSYAYRDAIGYGWAELEGRFDWRKLVLGMQQEVQRLSQLHTEWLDKAGVTVLKGRAAFLDPHTLEIDGHRVTADKILIAVGGEALKPDLPGIEHTITSREMFNLEQQPQRLIIIGSGYIGVEFASILRGLGTEVTLLARSDRLLSGFDCDLAAAIEMGMSQHGVRFIHNCKIQEIQPNSTGLSITLEGERENLSADTILCAIGRSPSITGLGLENAGVECVETTFPIKGSRAIKQQAIAVDEYSRTNQDNIFAVGDCTNRRNLTPVAIGEGRAFADTVFGHQPRAMSYTWIPSAVFTRPEAATVGQTELEARQQFGEAVQCYSTRFRTLMHSLTGRAEKTFMKLVVHRETEKVLGAHVVGEAAAEMIQGLTLALRLGATKHDFDTTIGIHPSSAEEWFTLH